MCLGCQKRRKRIRFDEFQSTSCATSPPHSPRFEYHDADESDETFDESGNDSREKRRGWWSGGGLEEEEENTDADEKEERDVADSRNDDDDSNEQ